MPRSRKIVAIVALLALAVALVPVFQANILAPGDAYYFSNWDKRSQSLVLSKIAQDADGPGSTAFGLTAASPDPLSVYSTFDGLQFGAPQAPTGYSQYASSLGLQGYLFQGAYSVGLRTVNGLLTLESTLFSVVFVLFSALLALAIRRSVGAVFLFSGLVSPWVVSAAHNLYWVPWTWLLPACAAAAHVIATTRRWKTVWLVGVGVAVAVKSSTGYEYLTSVLLLAMSVPLLAVLLGRRGSVRTALRAAGAMFLVGVAGFVVVLVVHAFVAGSGSPVDGFRFIGFDALRRTQGSPSLDADPLVNASLHASVFDVLARYIAGWSTALFALGTGGPYPAVSIGTGGFWALGATAIAIVAVQLVRRPGRGRRNLAVLALAAAPPLSWLVLAKSHSFAETNETYLLWYFMLIPMLVWLVGSAVANSAIVCAIRGLPTLSGVEQRTVAEGRAR